LKTVKAVFVALQLPHILYKKHLRFYSLKIFFLDIVLFHREVLLGISEEIPIGFLYHAIAVQKLKNEL